MISKKASLLLMLATLGLTVAACGKNEVTPTSQVNPTPTTTITPSTKEEVKYEVSFEGTTLQKQTVKAGTELAKPTDPTRDNHIFAGWYKDQNFSEEVSFPLTINSDTKIYARFYDYETAFVLAREKTIGNDVLGYEYDYTIDATASGSFAGISKSFTGNTTGNAKYTKNANTSFYDSHTNSGDLFFDGTNYQIKTGNTLQKIALTPDDVVKSYKATTVDESYKFDSSSFAKALFEFKDEDIKSVSKTTNPNEYELNTSFKASNAMALVGNYVNSPMVENVLGDLPETNVTTHMFVTFDNGAVKTYKYEISISVSVISFSLNYNLTFKNVGKTPTINVKEIAGLSLTESQIEATKNDVLTALNNYNNKEHSGYNFKFNMGVDFPSSNEINLTVKGNTKRKVTTDMVYFHNDIEIDSDFKNSDLYNSLGIKDIHIKKTRLADGDVYNIEKKALVDSTYKVENYQANDNDSYFLLNALKKVNSFTFIQKKTTTGETLYSFGIDSLEFEKILTWLNEAVDINPLADAKVKIFGDFKASSVKLDDVTFIISVKENQISKITIKANGDFETKYAQSQAFTNLTNAKFDLSYDILVTSDGDSFEPYTDVKKAK